MAEDTQQQDRTEEPTPKRRQDARDKGDVPRSRELTMTAVMLTGTSALMILAEPMGRSLMRNMSDALAVDRARLFDDAYPAQAFAESVVSIVVGLLPFGLLTVLAAVSGSALIGGWSFSLKAVAFKSERLSPLKGMKRIFSANGLNELLKAVAKFFLVAVAAIIWLWHSTDDLLLLGQQPIRPAISSALKISGYSFLIVSTTLILIATVDVPFQLWNYNKKLRMTRREVRDEFKDTEGRPEVKAKIRGLQQQASQRRMMEDVPNADVVITNPTHFAVALKYSESSMRAPKVVAKGKNLIAKRIREAAEQAGVPLYSAPPLARALYGSTELGQEIPAGLYTAVAQVLAYIFRVRESVRGGADILKPDLPDINETQYT